MNYPLGHDKNSSASPICQFASCCLCLKMITLLVLPLFDWCLEDKVAGNQDVSLLQDDLPWLLHLSNGRCRQVLNIPSDGSLLDYDYD